MASRCRGWHGGHATRQILRTSHRSQYCRQPGRAISLSRPRFDGGHWPLSSGGARWQAELFRVVRLVDVVGDPHHGKITQFRNRLLVMVQWGWTFFTRDRPRDSSRVKRNLALFRSTLKSEPPTIAQVARNLCSFRISSLLCSSVPLRLNTVCLKHGEILKRRGKEEQRKT